MFPVLKHLYAVQGKRRKGENAVSSINLETKGINWNLLARKVNGEGGSNRKGVGKKLQKSGD